MKPKVTYDTKNALQRVNICCLELGEDVTPVPDSVDDLDPNIGTATNEYWCHKIKRSPS